ncbi:MAG TPA: diguanylate cyclase [Methylophilaceae bacterium]|nr:diguanylate cyclase [Methylophilaceae bacterium]
MTTVYHQLASQFYILTMQYVEHLTLRLKQFSSKQFAGLFMLFGLMLSQLCHASPLDFKGQWYQAPLDWQYVNQHNIADASLIPVAKLSVTGGHYIFQSDFKLEQAGSYVIDFKNSSTLANFRHFIYRADGNLIASMQGGINSREENPYFLRHGREVSLPAGDYRIVTELESPYFIAIPEPYIDEASDYQQAIKLTNALTFVCLGIFIGLGIYYTALAGVRMRITEGMYALFILGNLIFNATSLLVLSDLFGVHQIHLSSLPILFSNIAYILFAMSLLKINQDKRLWLFKVGVGAIGIMLAFVMLAAFLPNWRMEFARYGVGIFLCYGLLAAIATSIKGNRAARMYLISILVFFAMGGLSITSQHLMGTYTFYIEHLGLISVAGEVVLLALVLSYQFSELSREKEHALMKLEHSEKRALHDALTGLPNRYALEEAISLLSTASSLTFLDLDNLKYYNDHFGHDLGDKLLRDFSHDLRDRLGAKATLHRLGGDEFAITCPSGDQGFVEIMLDETVQSLRQGDFEFSGFSMGTVHVYEGTGNYKILMHMADTRMYENKRQRKRTQPQPINS